MNIVIMPSNEYASYAGTMLTSIFENNKGREINIYILSIGYSEENNNLYYELANKYNQNMKIIKLEENDKKSTLPAGRWGIFAFMALLTPKYLDVDRALYLDCDITCVGDITQVDDIDISNYYVALPPDTFCSKRHKDRLGMKPDSFYGCAGVIYMNLKKMREDGFMEKCLSYAKTNYEKLDFAIQDLLNVICEGNVKRMPMRFNLEAVFFQYHSSVNVEDFDEFRNECKMPVLIHFMDRKKAWHRDCRNPLKVIFWKYAKQSGWRVYNNYSSSYDIFHYTIEGIRYFLHRVGIKKYPYIFLSTKELQRLFCVEDLKNIGI